MLFFADKVVCKGLTFNYIMLMPYYSVVSLSNFKPTSCFNKYRRTNCHVVMGAVYSFVDGFSAIDKDKRNFQQVKQ